MTQTLTLAALLTLLSVPAFAAPEDALLAELQSGGLPALSQTADAELPLDMIRRDISRDARIEVEAPLVLMIARDTALGGAEEAE